MIYLIRTTYYDLKTKEVIDLLKIGYTKDINKRFDSYLLHNPECKLLDTREGDVELENYFHRYYSKLKYPNRNEWFYYDQEIVNNFQLLDKRLLTKEMCIKKLKDHLMSLIPTIDQLKSKYLLKILGESKEKYPEIYENSKYLLINSVVDIWRRYCNKELSLVNSFDYDRLLDKCSDLITFDNFIDLDNNCLKKIVNLYYEMTQNYYESDKEEFIKILEYKLKNTKSLLRAYDELEDFEIKQCLSKKYESDLKNSNYSDDYITIKTIFDSTTKESILKPVMNELMMVVERRAFDIQQEEFKNIFTN